MQKKKSLFLFDKKSFAVPKQTEAVCNFVAGSNRKMRFKIFCEQILVISKPTSKQTTFYGMAGMMKPELEDSKTSSTT